MDLCRQVIPGARSYRISAETVVRLFVAVTDYHWFQVHAAQASVEEVNFWQPSPDSAFKALSPGEPLLFKLHSPRNFIAGGGFFTKFVDHRDIWMHTAGLCNEEGPDARP